MIVILNKVVDTLCMVKHVYTICLIKINVFFIESESGMCRKEGCIVMHPTWMLCNSLVEGLLI